MTGSTVPLNSGIKKQGSSSSHTAEAETVSLSSAVRHDALPAQHLLKSVYGETVPIKVHEDNAACIISIEKGYSPAMRYLLRTQRVSIGLLNEITTDEALKVEILKEPTASQKGDMFTKELPSPSFWKAVAMIGVKPKL